MRNAFVNSLMDWAKRDPSLWLLNGDLGYSVLEPFAQAFPDRYLNVGIAEQTMAGVAAGLAAAGQRVVYYSIANFSTLRCLEQIRNDICSHNLPVLIVSVGGGTVYGSAGYTHFAVEDLNIMRCLPNISVLAPGDPMEVNALMGWVEKQGCPAYLRLGRGGEPVIHKSMVDLKTGYPLVVRDGKDVAIVSTGALLQEALAAAEQARLSIRVVSVPFIKPFAPDALIDAIAPCRHAVLIEEQRGASAFSALWESDPMICARAGLNIKKVQLGDEVISSIGDRQFHLKQAGLDASALARLCERIMEG